MERITNLLVEKNSLLSKFVELNETELLNVNDGNFDNLENFYNSRETLLEMISKLDASINKSNQPLEKSRNISEGTKKEVIQLLDKKNDLVHEILSQDLQILSYIESAKSQVIKQLLEVRAAKKAVGAFKSGAEIHQLNEKA